MIRRVLFVVVAALAIAPFVGLTATSNAQAATSTWSNGELQLLERAVYHVLEETCDNVEIQKVPGVPKQNWPQVYICMDLRASCHRSDPLYHPTVAICAGYFQLKPAPGVRGFPPQECDVAFFYQKRIVNGRVRYRMLYHHSLECRRTDIA